MKAPLVSIIVVLYNNWYYTKKCLQSLELDKFNDKEVIVVDNCSSDETITELPKFVETSSLRLQIIWNTSNLGFAKANNIGIRAAQGDYIVLLNNDTYVTCGWIKGLMKYSDKKRVGLVGPVTNNIGNEAKINIRYKSDDMVEMQSKAKKYTDLHFGETISMRTIAAFCWMMKRAVFDEIGYLDERFERGWFEDDDYCYRVKKAGYKILVVEEVFIHHEGGKSFNLMKKNDMRTLFNINKKKFEEKWGIQWTPHHYSRIKNIEIKEILEKIMKISVNIKTMRQDLLIDDGYLIYSLFHSFKNYFSRIEESPEPFDYTKYLNSRNKEKLKTRLYKLRLYQERLVNFRSSIFYTPFIFIHFVGGLLHEINILKSSIYLKYIVGPNRKKNRDIIIFAIIGYTFRHQRPQHLAEQLSRLGYRIFYIEQNFNIVSTPLQASFTIKKIKPNVFDCTFSSKRNVHIYTEKPSSLDKEILLSSLGKLIKSAHITNPILKIDHPFWGYVLNKTKYPIIYDCMDDHESFEMSSKELVKVESKLVKKAQIILTASHFLTQKIKKSNPKKIVFLPNAGEYNHFAKAQSINFKIPHDMIKVTKKIIGYYGAIAEWFDSRVIVELAEAFPHCSIVLIGAITHYSLKDEVKKYPNIYLLGEKSYRELPSYLQMFDVCLIPFVLTDLIKATNPVKIYEYFAAGKAVVASRMPELEQFKDYLYMADTPKQFVALTKVALEEKEIQLKEKRIEIAKENTWEKRGIILHNALINIRQ